MSGVDDRGPFRDGEGEGLSGAQDGFEEDGEDEIGDGDVVAAMAHSLPEQRKEDVIDVHIFLTFRIQIC